MRHRRFRRRHASRKTSLHIGDKIEGVYGGVAVVTDIYVSWAIRRPMTWIVFEVDGKEDKARLEDFIEFFEERNAL